MLRSSRLLSSLAAALLLVGAAGPARAQAPADAALISIPLGEPVERMAAASDTTQHYALYLPSGYDPASPPPVVFLMDPRGRAMVPLDLFREAAEARGYLLISSHETLSDADDAFAVNEQALTAMVRDVQLRFTADLDRLYLVGFSGTAHFCWFAAPSLDGHVAGIVGVGDGLDPTISGVRATLAMDRPPAYFGIAGTRDFNYDPAVLRDRHLDNAALQHRFRSFPGRHAWPPDSLAAEALAWFDLLAQRDTLGSTALGERYTSRLAEATAFEADGNLREALRRYREIVADFGDTHDTSEAASQADRLARFREVRRELRNEERRAERVSDYKLRVNTFVEEHLADGDPVSHDRATRRLDLRRLIEEAGDTEHPLEADAAGRMLTSAFAQLAFYGPSQALDRAQYATADGLLRLALVIQPAAAGACFRRAQALAQLGRIEEALGAADCAAVAPSLRPQLRTEPLLEPLRQDARFADIVGEE